MCHPSEAEFVDALREALGKDPLYADAQARSGERLKEKGKR